MTQQKLSDLKGFGPKSETMLASVGIVSVESFMQADPFELYRQLKRQSDTVSLNALYAMIGAQQDKHWQLVAKEMRQEILIRLDDMGLAP